MLAAIIWISLFLETFTQVFNTRNKADELAALTRRSPLISLDRSSFDYFSNDQDRNYSLIVLFKIRGYRIPPVFNILFSSFEKVAKSAASPINSHIHGVFFAKITDNELTNKYCRKFNFGLIPILVHFPPGGHLSRKEVYDIRWSEPSVDSINFWIRSRTLYQIAIVREFSLVKFVIFVATLSVLATACYVFQRLILAYNTRKLWSIVLLGFVCLMLGGFMYVVISHPPFVSRTTDTVSIISSGLRGQYGMESYLIAFLYAGITASLVVLNSFNQGSFSLYKQTASLCSFVICVALYVFIFRSKVPWFFN